MPNLLELTNLFSHGLMVGSLTLVAAAPIASADPPPSVGYVEHETLAATHANGWRTNPLRADLASTNDGNSLRQGVVPASYQSDADEPATTQQTNRAAAQPSRTPQGLQLRPHAEQTGIFSSLFGEKVKQSAPARAGSSSQPRHTQQANQSQRQPLPPKAAAQQAIGRMPQFQSSRSKQQSPAAAARTSQPTSFATAASAQAYRPKFGSGQPTTPLRQPFAPTQPSPHVRLNSSPAQFARVAANQPGVQNLKLPQLRPDQPSLPTAGNGLPSAAAALTKAHELAEQARTEADYSRVFAMCQAIPASKATAEEASFGRQLAAWSLNRRGQLRARSGNHEQAISDFNTAVRVDSKCWRALHNRGVLLAQAGQFESAFDDFHHTIELNPGFAKAFANRAALYVLAGELEPALTDYERAIEIDPNLAVAQRGCGRACHLLGRAEEAFDHLSSAIELAQQDALALASRGDLLTDLGEYAAAANDYARALAINPKSIDACRGSAWLLATCPDSSIRDPELALQQAETAAKLERKADASTLDTLAAAQANAGDFNAATETLRRAMEIAPPSERSVYQDRLQMYRQSRPYRIEPASDIRQVDYEQ